MEPLKKLMTTLESMIEAHSRLLEVAKEKRSILVSGDTHGLQNLVNKESIIIDEIQKLEDDRKNHVQDYMDIQGVTGQSFTLEELMNEIKTLDDLVALQSISKQLRSIIQELSHVNESNQQLIQTSLSFLQYSIGMHVRKEPAIGYGPKAGNRYSNLLDAKI